MSVAFGDMGLQDASRVPPQTMRPKNFLLILAVAALSGCKNTTPPTPLSQLTPQQSLGYQYFQSHCAQCHYDRQPGPRPGAVQGPSLLSLYKKPYLPSGAPANDDRVTATILHGHNMMPASPDTDPTDLQNLLAYLHSL
jgi:mono/diheme cytochrome c family protein